MSLSEGESRLAETERHHSELRDHYTAGVPGALFERILAALREVGKDSGTLRPEDLAPVDEFHTLGRVATLELARMAGITVQSKVLDVGCGVGGPARCLAAEFGCRVTGVDLFFEYCEAAMELTLMTGLDHLASFCCADATALPFLDAIYDVVWSQHVSMNIEEKRELYGEMNRVLKSGGTLALYEVLLKPDGPPGPIHLPVPWARTAATNFLVSKEELRELLREAGFIDIGLKDVTGDALRVFKKLESRTRERGLPPLGTHVLLGLDFEAMIYNQLRNFQEGRLSVSQVAARKS